MIGIYKITNLINGKVYIGQSININRRWRQHRECQTASSPLHSDIKKIGLENFSFEVLEEVEFDKLDERERFYIEFYDSYRNGYNRTKGGSGRAASVKLSEKDVEEIIFLLKTTNYLQQDIAKEFEVGEDTISEINQGKTRVMPDEKYPIRSNVNYCIDCGIKVSSRVTRCGKCSKEEQRVAKRPNRETLKKLIREKSFVALGKEFGVSDNAIRKWCKAESLPFRKKDISGYSEEEWSSI